MRETRHPIDRRLSVESRIVGTLAILAGFFVLLVALAHPLPVLSAAIGALSALLARRIYVDLREGAELCIPGTGVCLRVEPAGR